MSFDEFENLARLYIVGALEEGELADFRRARVEFGVRAEATISECQQLNAAFALSLRPQAPKEDAKAKLMGLIQKSLRSNNVSTR